MDTGRRHALPVMDHDDGMAQFGADPVETGSDVYDHQTMIHDQAASLLVTTEKPVKESNELDSMEIQCRNCLQWTMKFEQLGVLERKFTLTIHYLRVSIPIVTYSLFFNTIITEGHMKR